MHYTPEELAAFEIQDDIAFTEIDLNNSIKTNQFIFDRNFKSLYTYLLKLKAYSVYTKSLLNIDNIVNAVIEKFQSSKNILLINDSMQINDEVFTIVNGIRYKVKRLDDWNIEITNMTNPNWDTYGLMIQVKDINGYLLYPVISTIDNKINVTLDDGLQQNYTVFFI